jgi:hypothetical protein
MNPQQKSIHNQAWLKTAQPKERLETSERLEKAISRCHVQRGNAGLPETKIKTNLGGVGYDL